MEPDQDKLLTDKNMEEMDFDSQWDDIQLTPVDKTANSSDNVKVLTTEGEDKSNDKNEQSLDFDSEWDDIQLTPVTSPSLDSQNPDDPPEGTSLKVPKQMITACFRELDDSFMYLGVLKKLALPDAMAFFEKKFDVILKFLDRIWDNEPYPDKEQLFCAIGEDYQKLTTLIHSGDAIQPIYDQLKNVYNNTEKFKDLGIGLQQAMEILRELFNNRK